MDKLREDFEKWWQQEDYDNQLSNIQGVMFNRIKRGMFAAWQASRASIVVELPDPKEDRARDCSSDDIAYGFNQGVGKCKDVIRSIGLSIKGD
ncbi:hypothetical protein FOT61_11485 [Serratia marcescens]|uniref:hypothetical protein n=1 Tax=Serratia marcescens TaxID=615 RepID=UPI0011CB4B5D|nr:hypothetical protein [Serratia marcescens]TXE41407.1 hypothetical protein FOT61_11485 [Serratia marcescens]